MSLLTSLPPSSPPSPPCGKRRKHFNVSRQIISLRHASSKTEANMEQKKKTFRFTYSSYLRCNSSYNLPKRHSGVQMYISLISLASALEGVGDWGLTSAALPPGSDPVPTGRTACTDPQYLYSTAMPLLLLWAVRPVHSLSTCTVQLYLYSPYGRNSDLNWSYACAMRLKGNF